MSRGVRLGLVLAVLVTAGGVVLWQQSPDRSIAPSEVNQREELEADQALVRVDVAEEESPEEVISPSEPVSLSAMWSELNRIALEKLAAGDLEGAISDLEQCVEEEPNEPVFSANLAEALARLARSLQESGENSLEPSILLLERAMELAPERGELARLLSRWKATAATEEDFWTDETAHFLVSYDGGRSDVMKYGYYQLESMLEIAYDDFGVALNHYPVGHGDPKIRVVLYRRDEFTEITGIGHWAGGVFDGVVRIPLGDFETQKAQLELVLRHEVLHAFVRSLGGKEVPAWLNEGLAQWFEEPSAGRRESRVKAARAKLKGRTSLFPLEILHGTLATWKDESDISFGYAQSLALVDHLSRWYGEPVLIEMVRGCKKGVSSADSFALRTGLDLESILQDLAQSL